MYMPVDPNKLSNSWNKLEQSLLSNKFYYSIRGGKSIFDNISIDVRHIIKQLKEADYVRIGSNKMNIIPAHFAINFEDYSKGKLVELMSLNNLENTLRNDLILVIQFAFFENQKLNELIIPIIVDNVSDPDVTVEADIQNHQMIISRAR